MIKKIINPDRYKKIVAEAQAAHFSGWDFSWLKDRLVQEDPPWDYKKLVTRYKNNANYMLDIGTGGGEFLSSLVPLPTDTHATETFPPNQRIARDRLSPLGVEIHDTSKENPLPFNNNTFDLIINRHEDYDPVKVHNILKPSGIFLTQQVGGLNNLELNQILQEKVSFPFIQWGLAPALIALYDTGFLVEDAQQAALTSTFLDIGAVVYFLKAIPWQVAGFNPETHAEGLINLHNIIETQGKFVATAHRFLIIAKKKAPSP